MSNYVRTQDGHNRAPYKLHYRTYVNGYRGGGLRRKGSKSVENCGYQFHSHTAHSTPLPPQTSPSQALPTHITQLSRSRFTSPSSSPSTSAKDSPTLLPPILWPFLITKDIESLPKNSREYLSPELHRLPLIFLPILKKLPNSPKRTTEYHLQYQPEPKNLYKLPLK